MDYLHLIKKHYSEKEAIILDSQIYTYKYLIHEAEKIRSSNICSNPVKLILIKEKSIIQQLILFIAYSGTNRIPLISPLDSSLDLSSAPIPAKACMAVASSGTTGKNKIFYRSYDSWASFFPIQNDIFQLDQDCRMFVQGSLSFTGNLNMYLSLLSLGATIITTDYFHPQVWNNLINDYKANAIYLIPVKLKLLVNNSHGTNVLVRTIVSGSQLLSLSDANHIKNTFVNSKIFLYYGASELNYVTYIEDKDMTEDKTLVGRAFPNVNIIIKDSDILVDTPYGIDGITLPYPIGDCGYLDQDQMLHLLGRNDDICNINGMKVSLLKVENALLEIEGITNASVVCKKKEDVDILVAYIEGEQRWSDIELRNKLKTTLTILELPKQFIYKKFLPKNESGKVIKGKVG